MSEHWLIVAHEASNSGAPRVLLEVLRQVRRKLGASWSCRLLFQAGGPLLEQFRALGPTHVLSHPWADGRNFGASVYRAACDRPLGRPWRLRRAWAEVTRDQYTLVYNNTTMNGALMARLRELGCPILTHVHELGEFMRSFTRVSDLQAVLTRSDGFLAVSDAVAADLRDSSVPASRITVVPNFLSGLPPIKPREEARRELGLPERAAVIVGCGHLHAIKGTDLFVALAAAMRDTMPAPQRWIWLGGVSDCGFARAVRRQVRRAALTDVVRFPGRVPDAAPWLAAADVVAVTSRQESFSLVALEAAALGRPVVGFAGARGIVQVLGEFPELLAPDFDLGALAALTRHCVELGVESDRLGHALRAHVGRNFVGDAQIERILSVAARLRVTA